MALLPYLIPDSSKTIGHWNAADLLAGTSRVGTAWAEVGTVPSVASGLLLPAGVGPFSDSNYFTQSSGSPFNLDAGPWTIAMVLNPASLSNSPVVIASYNSGVSAGYYIQIFAGSVSLTFGGVDLSTSATLILNGLNLLICGLDASGKLYIQLNGGTIGTASGVTPVAGSTVHLGNIQSSTGYGFDGAVYEVMISTDVPSTTNFNAIYAAVAAGGVSSGYVPASASSFLQLNGVNWPVSTDQAQPKDVEIGQTIRAIDGTEVGTRRALKREWKLKTIPYSPTDALAFRYAVRGEGHHWSFDSNSPTGTYLYSDKGLLNSASSGTLTYATSTPSPKFGAGELEISSGGSVTWAALVGEDGNTAGSWSVIVWFYNGSSWDGYAVSYNGSSYVQYKNGVVGLPALPGFISASGSGLALLGKGYGGSNQVAYFDDLVVLPYLARPADLAVWSGATAAFAPLPKVGLSGTMVSALSPNAPAYVYGTIDGIDEMFVNTGDGNGVYPTGQRISFSLREP